MRVGIVVDDSIDRPNGVQQIVHTTGAWLAAQGHEVHLVTSQSNSHPEYASSVVKLGTERRFHFNGNVTGVPVRVDRHRALNVAKELRLDVIHVHAPYSPLLAHRVIKGAPKNCAVVASFHMAARGRLERLGARALGWLVRASSRRISCFIADSPVSADLLESEWKRSSVMISNPIALSQGDTGCGDIRGEANSGAFGDRVRLLFLGRLVRRKGAKELIEALAKLPNNVRSRVSVDIAGSGPELAKLETLVQRLGLARLVTFRGQVSEHEKQHLLANSDIAIFPSLYAESFGMVIVEAIAAGRAVVVAGDNPGYRYVLADTPNALIHPKKSESFAEEISRLVIDASARQKLLVAQRAVLETCDISYVGPQLLAIYDAAVEARTSVGRDLGFQYSRAPDRSHRTLRSWRT